MIENIKKWMGITFPHPDELFYSELQKTKEQMPEEKGVSTPKVEVVRLFTKPLVVVLVFIFLFLLSAIFFIFSSII